jgi:hypothetical protein
MSKLLIDEPPLQVLPSLAEAIGLNEAIVLQQIHYWLGHSTNIETDQDGVTRRWVYKSLSDWQDEMSFWSESTIKRTLRSLKDEGLIFAEQKRLDEGDPTVWYSINYDALSPSGQDDKKGEVKMNNSSGQDEHPRVRGTARARTENTTENNSNSAGVRENDAVQAYQDVFPRRPNHVQAEQIATKVDDLDLWRAVMRWWATNGHRAKSVGKMLNKYRQTDTPEDLYRDAPSGDGAPGTAETASKPDDPRTEIR